MSGLRVILASSSPRRRDLMAMLGIAHEVMPAEIDERYLPGEPPIAHAERLAREKGAVIATRVPDAVVISADTIVVIDDLVLGKPRDDGDAAAMLRRLAGRTHTVFTAVAVSRDGRIEETIRAYIATREPMDKAGAYGIQGYGAAIVERIDGDYFAVMGLAVGRMLALLRRVGVRYDFRGLEPA